MLQGDDFTFAYAIDPDKPRAYGAGIHRARMLHKGFAIEIHAPHFNVEAYVNARLKITRHKNTGENGLIVLSKRVQIQWKHALRAPNRSSVQGTSGVIQTARFCNLPRSC